MPVLPVHPFRKTAEKQVRLGRVAIGMGIVIGLLGISGGMALLLPLCGALVVLGGTLAYLGAHTKTQCDGLVARGMAIDLANRGDFAAAQALLEGVRLDGAALQRAIEVQRTQLALEQADAAAAETLASAPLSRPIRGFSRDVQSMQNAHAHALRAMARASLGKDEDAMLDIAATRASDAAMPEVLAVAAVAEQMVFSRRGDLEALSRALEAARPLLEATPPRERALVRAFRGLVMAKKTSAYREPGRTDDATRPGSPLDGWAARLAPEAAAFLPPTALRAQTALPDVTQPASTPVGAGSSSIVREASHRREARPRRRGIAAVLFFVCFLAFWQLLSRTPFVPDVSTYVIGSFFSVLVVALFLGRIAQAMRLEARGRREVLRARRVLASGDAKEASILFRVLTKSRSRGAAAEAHLELAMLAERKTDLRSALDACDAGLATLAATHTAGAGHADLLLPRLVSERAFVLAGLGRDQQAHAELAALASTYPSYAHLTAAIFRTRLLVALRGASIASATEIARERTPQLALGLRDETMADAVLALADEHPRELARLHQELGGDPELAQWLDFMVPGARERIATRASR